MAHSANAEVTADLILAQFGIARDDPRRDRVAQMVQDAMDATERSVRRNISDYARQGVD